MNKTTRLIFRAHAIRRMFARGVSVEDIREIVENGRVIDSRPNDVPYPSRLVLGYAHGRPLHVVVAEDAMSARNIVVTVYQPEPTLWYPGYTRRRRA